MRFCTQWDELFEWFVLRFGMSASPTSDSSTEILKPVSYFSSENVLFFHVNNRCVVSAFGEFFMMCSDQLVDLVFHENIVSTSKRYKLIFVRIMLLENKKFCEMLSPHTFIVAELYLCIVEVVTADKLFTVLDFLHGLGCSVHVLI